MKADFPNRQRLRLWRCAAVWLALVIVATTPATVYAHGDEALAPDRLWSAWTWTPLALIGAGAIAGLYSLGIARLWQRARVGHGVTIGQAVAFVVAVNTSLLALFSPLDALSDSLFAAHMVQHMLLVLIAAPLLALSAAPVALLWSLPRRWARAAGRWWGRSGLLARVWRFLVTPHVALIAFSLALWAWHVPSLYEAALHDDTVHEIEHATFFGTAILFWWSVFRTHRSANAQPGASFFYSLGGLLLTGALGALLTFSQRPWYAGYAETTAAWGLTPLEDQQLGGVIMWAPGHLTFAALVIVLFYRWLNSVDDDQPQRLKGRPGVQN